MSNDPPRLLKVSKTSSPQSLAAAIQHSILDDLQYPCLRAIGHGAVGQAVKALAIARGHVAVRGIDLVVTIGFETLTGVDGDEISALTFTTFRR